MTRIKVIFNTYILKIPKLDFSNGAFSDVEIPNARIILVSTGSIIPSSHNLEVE